MEHEMTKDHELVQHLPVEEIEVEEVDVEEYARRGEKKPRAKRYRIRIDKQRFVVEKPTITGREVLDLVKLSAPQYCVYLHVRGGQPRRIEVDERVDLTAPGTERFTTMRCNLTDGRGDADGRGELEGSREYRLPEGDESHLDGMGRRWDTLVEGGSRWLVVRGFEVPPGFNHSAVDVALLIPATYPDTQIDMGYFRPALARPDGRAIPNLCDQAIRGETWQRWSRHRTDDNPWRPGIDDVGTHLNFVTEWLRRELNRG